MTLPPQGSGGNGGVRESGDILRTRGLLFNALPLRYGRGGLSRGILSHTANPKREADICAGLLWRKSNPSLLLLHQYPLDYITAFLHWSPLIHL